MQLVKKVTSLALLLAALSLCAPQMTALAQKSKKSRRPAVPLIWQNPGNVAARNLSYGPGSAELAPAAPFTFVKEDKSGESPKFDVKDARGVEWRVKLGPEAKSETV